MVKNDRLYGAFEVAPVIAELLQTQSLKRLSHIHQSGAAFLAFPQANATRLEHSLGVVYIIQRLGGSVEEQVAGLLHDISHSAFSHVIDYLKEDSAEDTHEKMKEHFFYHPEILQILQDHQIDPEAIFHESSWPRLEAALPDLCADRIDYTLRDYVVWAQRPHKDVAFFLKALDFQEGRVVLRSVEAARWFQNFYQELNRDFFRHPINLAASRFLVDVLREALDSGVLQEDDLFTNDQIIINKVAQSSLRRRIEPEAFQAYLKSTNQDQNSIPIKSRVVDPLVQSHNRIVRLSVLQ